MKKTILAVPALVILLGVGTTATAVYAHGPSPVAINSLTDEQQDLFETLRELMHAGKIEEAKAFAQANGLPSLKHKSRLRLDHELTQALRTALANEDYQAFVELAADSPLANELTAEVFASLVEAHTLMEAGDMQGAKEILQNLDLDIPILGLGHHFAGRHVTAMVELTDEQKDLLDQARKLRQAGDQEAAQEIIDSLDLPMPPFHHLHN